MSWSLQIVRQTHQINVVPQQILMHTFFYGWRRKVGVVALVLACVVTGLWMRTRFFADQLVFPMGGRTHYVNSAQNGICWLSLHSASSAIKWDTIPNGAFDQMHLNRPLPQSLNELVSRHTAAGLAPACRYLLYWWLAIPLTVLSAYLLLVPSRKQLPTASKPDA